MLKEERLRYILEKIETDDKVHCAGLSQELQVSEDTIRRDLNELSDAGRVKKVHGGAISRSPNPLRFRDRQTYGKEQKKEIARKVLPLLHDGQVIIMTGGTTPLQIAMMLPEELKATILTNSIPTASYLTGLPNIELIMAGGRVHSDSQVTIGCETAEAIRNLRADLCLASLCSIHPETGITMPSREEAEVERYMFSSASMVVGLCTQEKLNTAEAHVICPAGNLDILITEMNPNDPALKPYRALGIDVK